MSTNLKSSIQRLPDYLLYQRMPSIVGVASSAAYFNATDVIAIPCILKLESLAHFRSPNNRLETTFLLSIMADLFTGTRKHVGMCNMTNS